VDKIIFTQDLPGERNWIESQFPGFVNLQSEFSGLWPTAVPSESVNNTLWEIPPDSNIDCNELPCEKILSVYQYNDKFVDARWCKADTLMLNLDFSSSPKSDLAQVITFTRSGTVFLEKLLYGHLNYTELSPHYHFNSTEKDLEVIDLIDRYKPDIFVTYRQDWWAWFTSYIIALRNEFTDPVTNKIKWPHRDCEIDWENALPFDVPESEMTKVEQQIITNWNAICHLRTRFRSLNFYLSEFSEITKINLDRLDKPLTYDKRKLIRNYNDLEQKFKQTYLPKFRQYEENAIAHLKAMGCVELAANTYKSDIKFDKIEIT
jgi:hypothetical protein